MEIKRAHIEVLKMFIIGGLVAFLCDEGTLQAFFVGGFLAVMFMVLSSGIGERA